MLPILCIVGPTATGKSDLGVELALAIGGEVISADSMQVYRRMDIGTAKMTHDEMKGVPHHLIDVVDPSERYSAAEWKKAASTAVEEITARGRLPIVVGGTGLYIRALTEDLDFAQEVGSPEVREKWRVFLEQEGTEALHLQLQQRDPVSAKRLHKNDVRRVIRALEVFELTDRPLAETYDWRIKGGRYDVVLFGLTMPRAQLYSRVNDRVDLMMSKGLREEVAALLADGYDRTLTSMQAIGYKEMAAHLFGESSLEEAVAAIKQATRRFVKRQVSWFQRDSRIRWLDALDSKDAGRVAVVEAGRRLAAGIPVQGRE